MISSEIVINRPDGDTLRIRERHTDATGRIHIKSYNADINDDINALLAQHSAEIDAQLKQQEVETYKNDVKQGINPFQTRALVFNTRAEALKPILDDALSQPATDPIVYNGLPYLQYVTDAELVALYGQDQAWVDNIRLTASDLLTNKTAFDSYVPPLGGG